MQKRTVHMAFLAILAASLTGTCALAAVKSVAEVIESTSHSEPEPPAYSGRERDFTSAVGSLGGLFLASGAYLLLPVRRT